MKLFNKIKSLEKILEKRRVKKNLIFEIANQNLLNETWRKGYHESTFHMLYCFLGKISQFLRSKGG